MIYMLCTDSPRFKADGTPVRHYLGFVGTAERLNERLHEHNSGKGSRLTNAVHHAGGTWFMVAIWPDGTYDDEQRMHINGKFNSICPKCLAERAGRLWTPNQLERMRLPARRRRRSNGPPRPDFGVKSPSTPEKASGLSLVAKIQQCATPSTAVIPTLPPPLGGYVSGASVQPTSTGYPSANTKQRSI
jgi:hypothetical protein